MAKTALSVAAVIDDPPAGVVIKIVGATSSLVMVLVADVVELPAASTKIAVKAKAPSA